MPSSHLNHLVRLWCGIQNGAKKWRGLYKEIIFMNYDIYTCNSLTENEEQDISSQIMKTIFGLHASATF